MRTIMPPHFLHTVSDMTDPFIFAFGTSNPFPVATVACTGVLISVGSCGASAVPPSRHGPFRILPSRQVPRSGVLSNEKYNPQYLSQYECLGSR